MVSPKPLLPALALTLAANLPSGAFATPVDPTMFRIKGEPYSIHQTDQITVGNPTILEELQKLLAAHGTSQAPLRTLTPWDAVKMPVRTQIIGGLRIGLSDSRDFLMVRSFEIYAEPGAPTSDHRTISFLLRIHGDPKATGLDAPTPDMIRQGAIIAVAEHPGSAHPFTDFVVSTGTDASDIYTAFHDQALQILDGKPLPHIVTYRIYDQKTGQYIERVLDAGISQPSDNPAEQYQKDRQLFDAAFAIQRYVANSLGYMTILKGAEFSKGIKSSEQSEKSDTALTHLLSAPLMRLADRYEVIIKNTALRDYYKQQDPDFLPFMKSMVVMAKNELLLTQEDANKITELSTAADKLMTEALEKFAWKGKRLTRAEFYQTLSEIRDPGERRQLLESYSKVVLTAHQNGLFPMLTPFNEIAQKYGFANFAEYKGTIMHGGVTPAQFEQLCKDYHDANRVKLEQFIQELQRINGGKTVHEWDVHFLANELAKEKLEGKEVPKITFADALVAAKKFFQDIGIDLDQAPFTGNILFDTTKREDKDNNAFAEAIGDGSRAWFNTNFDTTEEITLEDLGTIVHELVHDIHFIQSAQRARGNRMMGLEGNPNIWVEGIAVAVDKLVTSRQWMDRYLAHLPQFKDPAVRKGVAEASEGLTVYEQMLVMSRARFEINLYQDKNPDGSPRSLDERLNFWTDWVRQYLHVEAMPGKDGGRIWATPHFAGSPGYYVSYSGALQTTLKATKQIYDGLEKNNDQLLRSGGATLLRLFDQGARLTNIKEIDEAI